MKYRDDNSKLGIYIVISLIIHLFIIFFFPFGTMRGVADEGGYGNRDFGFVQFVEVKTEVKTSNKKTESKEQKKESKVEEKKEEEKPKEEPEKEESKKQEQEKNSKINIEEKNKPEQKKITEEKTKTEAKTNSEKSQEIITSEESEMEIETKEKTNKDNEEHKEDSDKTKTEKEKEEEPPPPPPPTAGELIGLSPRPVYPKYLVSEQKTGTVSLNVDVNKSGKVDKVQVVKSSGIEKMDRTAILTIEKGWEFKNYKKSYSINIVVDYKIDKKGNTNVDVNVNEVKFK